MIEQDKPYEERLLSIRRQNSRTTRSSDFKGPIKVIRLCLLGILLPCLICVLILYMRYRVYIEQMYPLAISDMRILDNRVSTTWCQRQLIKANTTFNAFLLPDTPTMVPETKHLTMVRHLTLEDDTKEYWGFYLLRGSTVTLSTCVRWPGASLIVIRGHKHLHECAYIGDNSSEELDELIEAIEEGSYIRKNDTKDNAPSNTPHLMKRHRQDVEFHHPVHNNTEKNYTLPNGLDTTDITDPILFRKILDQLNAKAKNRRQNYEEPKNNTHVHRTSTIGKGEQKNFEFEISRSVTNNNLTLTSQEVMADVLGKLQKLGNRGNAVLDKINQKFKNGVEQNNETSNTETVFNIRGRHYSKPIVKYDDNIDRARRKRELNLSSNLNEHDGENNAAIEEDFVPDGIADDRGTINETTLNDRSNSEFWSSFSSSEEALLNCAGLILNLPLTPHRECLKNNLDHKIEEAYLANTVTYKVPTNGYYFFVFNSENEIQPNYIRVRFNLHKKLYNVSNSIAMCSNTTEYCAMDLKFFSDEKLVMELPVKEDEDLWNHEFVVVSDCEPRTALYVVCVIAVPLLVILFAFQ